MLNDESANLLILRKSKPVFDTKSHFSSQLWLCLGLGLLILIFYSNSFTAGLLFDSEIIIKMDPRLRSLNLVNLQNIFTRNYWWPNDDSTLYRPVTTLSYLFNYTILGNGESVTGYHVLNLLLHWVNAWLVFLIVRRLSNRTEIAALTAAVFAIHPVNTEAVTNVVGRADLLAAFSVLFGAWCYLRAAAPGTNRARWLALMGTVACLGVMSKENAVVIAAFVAIYDFLWQRSSLKTFFKESWPGYVALLPGLLLILLIRLWISSTTTVFEEHFLDNPLIGVSRLQRVMTAIGIAGRYLKLLIFPWRLSSDYSFNQIPVYGTGNAGSDTMAWVSLVLMALLLAGVIYFRKRQRLISWGIFFFFAMLLPTSNAIVTIGSIMAERFLYLPSVGLCAAAAVILCAISAKWKPAWVLAILVICSLGVRTFVRNSDWKDDTALWGSTVAASPDSYKAHMMYGNTILEDAEQKNRPYQQVIDDAIAQEEIAQSIMETQPPLPLKWQSVMVYLHLAKDYRMKGQFLEDGNRHDEAMNLYHKSLDLLERAQDVDRVTNQTWHELRLSRGVPPKEIPDIGNHLVYEQLCFTYGKLKQWENCERAGRYLEHIAPQQSTGYQLLGAAYFNLGRFPDAAEQFLAGLLVDPDKPDWYMNLSVTYENLGTEPNPVSNQGPGLQLNKDTPLVRNQLNQAAIMVMRLFEEAKKMDEGRTLRDRLVQQHTIPAEIFPGKS